MEKIPTAFDFYTTTPTRGSEPTEDVVLTMIEFAKLHVAAALKAAAEQARSKGTHKSPEGHLVNGGIDKDSILNAYPPENIK